MARPNPSRPVSIHSAPSSFVQESSPIAQPAQTVPASNGGVPGVSRFDVTISHDGTATVTLQWPNGDFSLQLYVTTGACADATGLVAGACNILGATRPGTRPGVLTSPVVSRDVVTVWVLNTDEHPQDFTVGVAIN
jgi:hypothetical protein